MAGQVDDNGLALTGFECHLLVSTEGLLRTFLVGQMADIYLHRFQTFSGAGVLHADTYLVVTVLWLADLELCITQTKAEGEQRLTGIIAISAVLHRVVEEVGQFVRALVEGDRQFAAWIIVAEEHFGQCLSPQFTTVPGLNDGITRLQFRCESHR